MRIFFKNLSKNKWVTAGITLLMFSMVFGMLQYYTPVASATAPHSSVSNSAYINGTFNGYQNIGTYTSGSATLNAIKASSPQSLSYNTPTSAGGWVAQTGYTDTFTTSSTNVQYWSGTTIGISSLEFEQAEYTVSGTTAWWTGMTWANLTIDGNTYSNEVFGSGASSGSGSTEYSIISPSWTPSISSGYYSMSVTISYTPNFDGASASIINPPLGLITEDSATGNTQTATTFYSQTSIYGVTRIKSIQP